MALPNFVLDQLSQPRGALAPITATVLNAVNARTILAGISALEVQPGQRALELGFGGGLSLPLLLRALGPTGQLYALESSPPMLTRARRRFILQRLRGRLRVEQAEVEKLPLGDASFDCVLCLNRIPFWTDVDAGLHELARVLVPGGRLVLGIPAPERVRELGLATRGFRVVVPERLGEQLCRYGLELLELRQTPDDNTLLVAARSEDAGCDDGL